MNERLDDAQDAARPGTVTTGPGPTATAALADLRAFNRDLGWISVLCLAGLLTAVVFVSAPVIDLWVAGLFADGQAGFPLARAAIPRWFNKFINNLAIVMGVFGLFGLGYTALRGGRVAGLGLRAYTFLVMSLVIAPGLVVNALFKNNWGRARPRQITEFGGTQEFSPPLVIANQCERNCSFVSGDAAMGFAVLAVALLIPFARPTLVKLALAFGAFIGGIRIIQGAHFLSDVIFSGIFVCLIILILKMIILDGRWWGVRANDAERNAFPETAPLPEGSSPVLGHLGLVHGQDAKAWRHRHLSAGKTGGWKGRLWLFFRSKPEDFGLDGK